MTTLQPPPIGSVFADFYVCDRFQRFWLEVLARVQSKQGRYVKSAEAVADAFWLTGENFNAAARLLGCDQKTIRRWLKEPMTYRRKVATVTPEDCRRAYRQHGSWEAARAALGLGRTAFAVRMRGNGKQSCHIE